MRYFVSFILTFLFVFSATLHAQEKNIVVDKIVAKVGGEIILYSEIEEQYAYLMSRQQAPQVTRCGILKNIIAQKLLINQAKIDSIAVSDQEVTAQLDARINRILQLMNNDLKQFESYYGKTVSQVKDEMRNDIKNQLLGQRMRSQINSEVEATPKETITFFKNMSADSVPYYNSEVQLNELVFEPIISKKQRQKTIDKLNRIRDKIESGQMTFGEAASTYSEDPGSARNNGSLGMKQRGSFVQEYEAAAYNLEKGQISDIVTTQFGYHLIKLNARRGNNIKTQHILITPELTEEDLSASIKKLDSIKQMIIGEKLSFEDAVKEYGYENVQSYNNGGGMVNPKSGDSFFEVGELEPDVYFAIDTLKVGEVAGPIKYRKQDGKRMLKLVQLQSISEPHRASLNTDYAKIKEMASQEKKYKKFQEWIEEKIQSTYISINAPYEKCSGVKKWIMGKKPEMTVQPQEIQSQ